MLTKNDAQFMEQEAKRDAEFAIQVIAKGSIVDTQQVWNHEIHQAVDVSYRIETVTIRLNHIALNAWVESEPRHYDPDWDGITREEGERLNKERELRRDVFLQQLADDLGIDTAQGGFAVKQIISEFFAVGTIRKICKTPRQ